MKRSRLFLFVVSLFAASTAALAQPYPAKPVRVIVPFAAGGSVVARMLLAGASAVEMTSAVMMKGARVLKQSIEELDGYLEEQGVTATQIIGEATDKLTAYTDQPARPLRWKRYVRPEAWPESDNS